MPMSTDDGELKPLVITDTRVLIADLFVGDAVGSAPVKLTADEIGRATRLARNTVSANMRSLPATGWFRLDWEHHDPYDFTYLSLHRRLFVEPCVRGTLALCINDFRARRSGKHAGVWDFQVEYAPPRMNAGELVGEYVPVSTWEMGGAMMKTARASLLIYCLERPDEFHHASVVGRALGTTSNAALRLLVRCEDVGLMVSELRPVEGRRDARVFRLNEKGIAVARSVADRAVSAADS